ncbi:MAG: hypothetical protein L6427_00600 [Actinomycetia bacterium]|nr:hypothetical protein [Actinomycetes bacterium]
MKAEVGVEVLTSVGVRASGLERLALIVAYLVGEVTPVQVKEILFIESWPGKTGQGLR